MLQTRNIRESEVTIELTPYQKSLYNEWALNPMRSDYNLVVDQVFTGKIDIEEVNRAYISCMNAYLPMRSNIVGQGEKVHWKLRAPLPVTYPAVTYHFSPLSDEEIFKLVSKPFDIEKDPLLRAHIIQLGPDRFRHISIVHHLVADGLSCKTLISENSKYYNCSTYGTAPSIESQLAASNKLKAHFEDILEEHQKEMHDFWKVQLQGIEGIDLKFLHSYTGAKKNSSNNTPGFFRFSFEADTVAKVRQLSRRYKLTPFMYGQMVFGLLIHRMSGQSTAALSYPAAILEGKDLMFGAHINNQVLGLRFSDDTTLAGMIKQISSYYTGLKVSKAKYLPVYEIARYASNKSVFDVGFIQTDLKDVPIQYNGTELESIHDEFSQDFPYRLLFEQEQNESGINYRVRYDRAFDSKLVEQFVNLYQKLFGEILDDLLSDFTEKKISAYHLLDEKQEYIQLHEWNATDRAYPGHKTIHSLFEEQAAKTPDTIAVVYEDKKLTYRELNERANQLAHYLLAKHSIQPGDRIAICLERSEMMLVSILAVLKAGAAYLPIDPAYPSERVKFMIEDAGTRLLLSTDELSHIYKQIPVAFELLEELTPDSYEVSNPVTSVLPSSLFYIIYTSGTTNRPKGVMIAHRHISVIIDAIRDAYDFVAPARISAFTSFGFDVSSSEFFISLLYGNELHILSETTKRDMAALSDYFLSNRIEYAYLPPAVLANLPKTNYPDLKTIIYAGEPCDAETGKYWSTNKRLYNYYGPTETNIATGKCIRNGEVSLIGRPVANAKTHILDANMQLLPPGVVGELYVGGEAVASGYLNLDELTNERFVANPFQTEAQVKKEQNSKLYKTGDLVRYLSDGDIEYIGRNDFQLKIRGYRIEPEEIEKNLLAYPGIRQSAVVAREKAGNKYLAGYYVSDQAVPEELLFSYLGAHLPEYMIPSVLVHVIQLPLTINGKTDRDALPEPDFTIMANYSAPETEGQGRLCSIYAECLGLEEEGVSIDDDFFRLGGNSIMAITLITRINARMNASINVNAIYRNRTIRQLAAYIEENNSSSLAVIASQPDNADALMSFSQERFWFAEKFGKANGAFNMPVAYKIKSGVQVDSIVSAIQAMVARHEVLRSFLKISEEGLGIQIVKSDALVIQELVVSSEEELNDAVNEAFNHQFTFENEYSFRVQLYRLRNEHYISLVFHHAVFDGWSMDILVRELSGLFNYYEALRIDGPRKAAQFEPAPLKIQYKDFAVWQRHYLTGPVLEEQLNYWKKSLAGYETLSLPTDRPRPPKVTHEGGNVFFLLDKDLSNRLRETAKAQEISMYSLLLSGFYLLMHSYSGQEDIIIGTPVANRHFADIQDVIGCFINSLALRQQIDGEQTLSSFTKQVSNYTMEAQLHQDLPFDKLVSELMSVHDASRHPIFQVMFNSHRFVENFNAGLMDFLEKWSPKRPFSPAQVDIHVMMDDSVENIKGKFNYAVSLFDESTILLYIETYKVILEQLAGMNESRKIKDINYLNKNKVVI